MKEQRSSAENSELLEWGSQCTWLRRPEGAGFLSPKGRVSVHGKTLRGGRPPLPEENLCYNNSLAQPRTRRSRDRLSTPPSFSGRQGQPTRISRLSYTREGGHCSGLTPHTDQEGQPPKGQVTWLIQVSARTGTQTLRPWVFRSNPGSMREPQQRLRCRRGDSGCGMAFPTLPPTRSLRGQPQCKSRDLRTDSQGGCQPP